MSEIQDFPGVSVVGVTQAPTRNGGTRYVVALSNGMQPSTFDAGVATKAHSLAGQPAVARLESKPNNRGGAPYLNILDIAPEGQALGNGGAVAFGGQQAQAAFGAPAQATAFGGAPAATGFAQQQATPNFPQAGAEKDEQMNRGYSLGAAAAFVGSLYSGTADAVDDTELLGKVLRFASAFAHYRSTGKNIAEAVQASAAAVEPVAQTPEAVQAAVNAVAPGAVQLGAPAEAPVEDQPAEAPAPESTIPWGQA